MNYHAQNMMDHIKYLNLKSFEKLENHPNLEAILHFMFGQQFAALEDKSLYLNIQTGWRIYDVYTTDDYCNFTHIDLEECEYFKEMVASEFKVSDFRIQSKNLILHA